MTIKPELSIGANNTNFETTDTFERETDTREAHNKKEEQKDIRERKEEEERKREYVHLH